MIFPIYIEQDELGSNQMVQSAGKGWTKGFDQHQLTKHLWPVVRDVSCVHDAFLCQMYRSENWRNLDVMLYFAGKVIIRY